MTATPIAVGRSAVIVAADGKAPYALTTRHADYRLSQIVRKRIAEHFG